MMKWISLFFGLAIIFGYAGFIAAPADTAALFQYLFVVSLLVFSTISIIHATKAPR